MIERRAGDHFDHSWHYNLRASLERFWDFLERENVLEVAKGNLGVHELREKSNLHLGRLARRRRGWWWGELWLKPSQEMKENVWRRN